MSTRRSIMFHCAGFSTFVNQTDGIFHHFLWNGKGSCYSLAGVYSLQMRGLTYLVSTDWLDFACILFPCLSLLQTWEVIPGSYSHTHQSPLFFDRFQIALASKLPHLRPTLFYMAWDWAAHNREQDSNSFYLVPWGEGLVALMCSFTVTHNKQRKPPS